LRFISLLPLYCLPTVKKLTAIAFCGLLLFNWCGYLLLSQYLQHRADENLQAAFAQGQYQQQALLELQVPTTLPYTTDWAEWQDAEGTVEIQGVLYRYVQRKIQDGHLYVRCLPHAEKQLVLNARDQFTQLALSLEQNSDGKKGQSQTITVHPFMGDYDDQLPTGLQHPGATRQPQAWPAYATSLPSVCPSIGTPPPEYFS
jgi:hypothetical protein